MVDLIEVLEFAQACSTLIRTTSSGDLLFEMQWVQNREIVSAYKTVRLRELHAAKDQTALLLATIRELYNTAPTGGAYLA